MTLNSPRRFVGRAVLAAIGLALTLSGCTQPRQPQQETSAVPESPKKPMQVVIKPFGTTPAGEAVHRFILNNEQGCSVEIINYGAIVTALRVPDRDGKLDDVVLGYDNLDDYLKATPYFGAIVGRYGNRIAEGRFMLDGMVYQLARNNNSNHLHGGLKGFDKVVWQAEPFHGEAEVGVKLTYVSPDGEESYPGTMTTIVRYSFNNANELKINYELSTDKATIANVTHHSYFNLTGGCARDILEHEMMLNASRFTPIDGTLIPTGELRSVENTPMDFRTPTAIGARINADDEQIRYGLGYDHNWVLDREGAGLSLAARVHEPTSGRVMEVLTTEPGIQFYSGNFLDSSNVGKGGKVYAHRYGFCLETQRYPDSPNKPHFPSVVLRPGETYRSETVYRFSTR